MDSISAGTIILLIVLVVLSMLFSISESSFLGMNKLRLRLLRKKKNRKALIAGKLLDHREHLINTLLVSNDIVNILLSSIIAAIALDAFGEKGVGIATLIATIILLIFGEITPKTISTICPDKIAYALSPFIRIIYIIMTPVVAVVTFIARCVLFIFGIRTKDKKVSYTEEEIKTFFDMSEESGVIQENENRMMTQVFKFSDLQAEEIMVPRTKIRSLTDKATFRDVIELSERFGFTRFPIYRKSIDDIIGVIYLKDLLAYKDRPSEFEITKVMRPPLFVLGTMQITSVQELLFENHQSMAIVVDEYSGTDGVITEKDISREIFALPGENTLRGKVFDFDAVENKNDFEIDGSVLIKDLKKILKINLNSTISETVAGWFTEQLNRIAETGDSVEFEDWKFTVTKKQAHRIEMLRITQI
ncbi:MAG: hemolysin family protein [Treponema sp.]|nr:hemolysin family protein [Treponema sp.]